MQHQVEPGSVSFVLAWWPRKRTAQIWCCRRVTDGRPQLLPLGAQLHCHTKATFPPSDDQAQAHSCTTRKSSCERCWQNSPPSSPLSPHPGPSCMWSESSPASPSPPLVTHSISAPSISQTSDSTVVSFSPNLSIIVSPAYPLFNFFFLIICLSLI